MNKKVPNHTRASTSLHCTNQPVIHLCVKALFDDHDVTESGYLGLPEFMAVMTVRAIMPMVSTR